MPLFTYSQSNQIYIDGYFEDWVNINNYADPNDNIESGVDFINISVKSFKLSKKFCLRKIIINKTYTFMGIKSTYK